MAQMDVDKEIRDLKRRLDLAETRLSQMDGRFEFISGQLRDIPLYMHARFADIDGRLDKMDGRFDKVDGRLTTMDAKIDALPRAVAELIAKRG
jgi:tetrahydromethanopterin S-methyltransferase subunit G